MGYCYSDYHEAMSVSEPVPGPSTEHLQGICKGLDLLMFVGLIERQGEGCYNSAVLIGSEGVVGRYRIPMIPGRKSLTGLALRKKSTGTLCYGS